MAKKCPPGKYYCFTDKKCKKIPRGYYIGARGYLARDNRSDGDGDDGGENGNGKKGKYTHYGIFNGKIETSDDDIYPEVTNKQPGIWKDEFQYAFYVYKWIPLTNKCNNYVYNKINPKGTSRRKTLQRVNILN